jgi:hypothetical protein
MLLIALFYSISIFGYAIARNTTGQKPPTEREDHLARVYPLVEWPAVIICIVGQFWWGWYIILGVLCHGVYRSLRKPTNLKGNLAGLLRSWGFEMVFIIYVLFSKSFFWCWQL